MSYALSDWTSIKQSGFKVVHSTHSTPRISSNAFSFELKLNQEALGSIYGKLLSGVFGDAQQGSHLNKPKLTWRFPETPPIFSRYCFLRFHLAVNLNVRSYKLWSGILLFFFFFTACRGQVSKVLLRQGFATARHCCRRVWWGEGSSK